MPTTTGARPLRRSWWRSFFSQEVKHAKRNKDATDATGTTHDDVATRIGSGCATTMTANQVSSLRIGASPWFDGLLLVCFAYLDGATLVQCERVATEWHAAAQGPTLYGAQYCAMWRNGVALPAALASAFSRDQLKRFCRERATVPLELCTRASWWIQDDRTAHVLNVSLQSRRSYVVAIHVDSKLCPLGLSRSPAAVAGDHDKEGVCYYEVTIRGRGSVGVAQVDELATLDDARASSHVGWWHGSYGYHGFDGNLYWGQDQNIAAYGPSWGYQRGGQPPATDEWSTTIGCGLDMSTRRLFFTKNGEFLGFAPLQVESAATGYYCAAIALENRADTAALNLGRAPFVFDIEAILAERTTSPAAATMGSAG